MADTERTCDCKDALATALITQRDLVPEKLKRELAPIIGKYLPAQSKPRAARPRGRGRRK